ncbi:metalloregulator ArsR/SmtB family transcription factor [Thermotoga sp. SG1]|uniref:ArsR/SmtB family transcription factor n=1 Tax=Thermotoga sp. SG1 TaxID=126739 RepID=UPI000C7626F1|nr:metalloregulator ArsR/SmtB family transcription factor [Thermotoga sp. SG1]PLV57341.1 hypothetical protein AS006_00170 [Thermotoga sp. SG1]
MKEKNEKISEDFCELCQLTEEARFFLKSTPLEEETVYALAELFKTLSDPTRVKILYVLKDSEYCVHDIAKILGMSPSAVSHQLRILRDKRLVKRRRSGKSAYYSLDDDHVLCLFIQGLQHVMEEK